MRQNRVFCHWKLGVKQSSQILSCREEESWCVSLVAHGHTYWYHAFSSPPWWPMKHSFVNQGTVFLSCDGFTQLAQWTWHFKMHGISLCMYTVWLEKSSKIFSFSTWNFKRSTYFQWIQTPTLSSSVSRLLYMYLYVIFLHIALINLASISDRSQVAGSIMSIRCYSHCVNINQVVKCCHKQWSIASAVVLC